MRSVVKTGLVFAGSVLVLAGAAARADASDTVRVRVPFDFVVRNQTLPAGQYLLQREDTNPSVLLIQKVSGPHASAFVITNGAAGQDPKGDKPCVTFTRVENQYRLTNVWESRTDGRTVMEKE